MKGKPLPDIDELNDGVPEDEWEQGLNSSELKPPYQQSWYVHLLCPQTMERLTFIGGSVGAKIGVTAIQDAISDWRLVTRRKTAHPIVKLTLKPWRSKKWGQKMGPWFQPIRWVDLGLDDGLPRLESPGSTPRQLEHKPARPVGDLAQKLPDAYPNDYAEAVERPSTGEVLDDEIPF